jgi:hypothetical protein
MKMLCILGASDPEMDRIEHMLKENRIEYRYATKCGVRVTPSNAYLADNTGIPLGYYVAFVECSVVGYEPDKRIDHHRPGDYGYEMGPDRYLEASSLGQMCALLHMPFLEHDKILAAMDHCFNAAMKGECPGASISAVLDRKVKEISKTTEIRPEIIRKMINEWRGEISCRAAWYRMSGEYGYFEFEGIVVIWLTDKDLGVGYSAEYLTAQVGGVQSGLPILLKVRDTPDGLLRVHLCGNASPELVRHFMETEREGDFLEKIYGSPDRGYAGGVLRDQDSLR